MLAAPDLLSAFTICGDIRGLLKYGIGYWRRMRRIQRWQETRNMT